MFALFGNIYGESLGICL